MLVRQGRQYADLDYTTIAATAGPTVFIETGRVPGDSRVVGHTWRYVNRDGGPDRRFKDNRQIPRVRYGELRIATATGFLQVFQFSSEAAAATMASALSRAAAA